MYAPERFYKLENGFKKDPCECVACAGQYGNREYQSKYAFVMPFLQMPMDVYLQYANRMVHRKDLGIERQHSDSPKWLRTEPSSETRSENWRHLSKLPTEKPRCKICNKTFSRKSSLTVHLRSHTGEKPFKCTLCTKAFTQSANLVTHVRTHTGEKPYACPLCGRYFSQSSSVTTHMRTHTGERPFQCMECGMKFAERSTLSKHYRIHKSGSPSLIYMK